MFVQICSSRTKSWAFFSFLNVSRYLFLFHLTGQKLLIQSHSPVQMWASGRFFVRCHHQDESCGWIQHFFFFHWAKLQERQAEMKNLSLKSNLKLVWKLPDAVLASHSPPLKSPLIVSWKKLLVSFHISPKCPHLCTPHLRQRQNSGKVGCSSVCNRIELTKKGWQILPLLLSLLLEWCCLWQKAGLDPGLPHLHPINNTPRLNSRPGWILVGWTPTHLLWENLCEDVVRDVLAAPAPGHPLAHTWSQRNSTYMGHMWFYPSPI